MKLHLVKDVYAEGTPNDCAAFYAYLLNYIPVFDRVRKRSDSESDLLQKIISSVNFKKEDNNGPNYEGRKD